MWSERLEQHAAKMRQRAARAQERLRRLEASERLTPEQKQEQINRRCQKMRDARKAYQPQYTEDEIAVLNKHGAHTCRAAFELGWSDSRVLRAVVALGIVAPQIIEARKGRKGRPAELKQPVVHKERPKKYRPTPEIDAIIQAGLPIQEIERQSQWPRHAIYDRAKELGVVRSNVKYRPDSSVDEVIREYPGQLTKIATITGWPIWAVERRNKELGMVDPNNRYRDDEQEIVDLLRSHQGCMSDVRATLIAHGKNRTENYIRDIRDRHNIPFTKIVKMPTTRTGTTPALDGYIKSLLEMSTVRRNEYLKIAFAALPPVLSRQQIASLTQVSRKTIDSYCKQGWLPVAKEEFIQFIIDQCDYASMSNVQKRPHQKAANA